MRGSLIGQRRFQIGSQFQYFDIDFVAKSPRLFPIPLLMATYHVLTQPNVLP